MKKTNYKNIAKEVMKNEIEAIDDQKKKLKLMVKIFGRKTPLELNFMQVEKI